MNRFVRRYHASTGRRCVSQDEFLENGNRFFSEFPMPKSLQSFEEQSNQVGLALKAKLQSDIWYTSNFEDITERNIRKNVAPKMTPEKQLCYEIFLLLKTHVHDESREKFERTYITSIQEKISVDLRRNVLERSMHEAPQSPADDILRSLNKVYNDSIRQAGVDIAVEERQEGEQHAAEECVENKKNNTARHNIGKTSKVARRSMHKGILKEPWKEGRMEFRKKDVIKLRVEWDRKSRSAN